MTITARPRVVIIGAGFGGLFAARSLDSAPVDVTVVDKRNYHLFQPLLYQVAAAALAPSDIAWPIRSILHRQDNTSVVMGEVTDVDVEAQRVLLHDGEMPYDYLVVATGSTHHYFGHDEWRRAAPGLKTIDDATYIRRRLLLAFERAEMSDNEFERERLLKFVIVGAGPTGVELAGTIAELAKYTLAADFRSIDPASAQVMLVEAGERVLPGLHPSSSVYAQRTLENLGVEVRLGSPVTGCEGEGVLLGDERVASSTVIWAAGAKASPAGYWLRAPVDPAGRVRVEADLSLPGRPNVFVIGDAALVRDPDGKPVPGIAPAAKQQGRYVAGIIRGQLAGKPLNRAFRYRHAGSLATIGRRAAVIELGTFKVKGWLAWWLWGIAHIYFLVGVPSPVIVSLRWLWEYLTFGRGARLITGAEHAD